MGIPNILKTILSWEDIEAESLEKKELIERARDIADIIKSDYWTYITNDDDGFSSMEYIDFLVWLIREGGD